MLFEGLDWVLAPGDRVALVGPNGAGKTTLIKVMLGELAPDAGTRVLARGTRLGYLPQEAAEAGTGTVLDRALEAHRDLLGMRAELDALHQRLADSTALDHGLEPLLERAGELQHQLELHDEHALEPEARRVLAGLGFSPADQDRPLATFSGGWRMRAALAALLLTDPTLLFLDEPTNHLDLPALEWLEDYLETFHGGLVIVSHDRVFLDRVAGEVRELDRGELAEYAMTFTGYLEEREARRERLEAHNQQIDRKVAQLARFVERFGAKNTKAAQAQSKRKQIERLKGARAVIPRRPRAIRFAFPAPPHSGRTLVRLRDAAFGYGSGPDVFAGASLEIEKAEKVAIVGANGAGKTTLLRLIAGQLAPRSGALETPPHTRMAYFAQHAAETLDGTLHVLAAVEDVAPDEWRPHLRSLLGNFLFTGDDVFKACRVLSGGERQRVAIARLLLQPTNLLLLDEPTHHLDLAGKEVLEEALVQYPGAVVVVTHDRSLMARVATRVIEVEGGRVRVYPGGYDDWEAARLARIAGATAAGAALPGQPAPRAGGAGATAATRERGGRPGGRGASGEAAASRERDPRTSGRAAAGDAGGSRDRGGAAPRDGAAPGRSGRDARRVQNEQRRRERERERIESDIESREARLKGLEDQLADPEVYHDGARARTLVAEYETLRAELESLWQRLAEIST